MINEEEHEFLIHVYQKMLEINQQLRENIQSNTTSLEENEELAKILFKIICEYQEDDLDD